MNRRAFTVGTIAALVIPRRISPQTAGADQFVVFAPEVVTAYLAAYKNGTRGAERDEPLLVFFVAYEFANEGSAARAFPDICIGIEQTMVESLAELDRPESENRVVEASLGQLADDRFAVVNRPRNYASQSWSAIRVGKQILSAQSVAVSPDHLTYIVSWYEDYLGSFDSDRKTLLPELADMPVGWEVQAGKIDVTVDVRQATPSTPTATP